MASSIKQFSLFLLLLTLSLSLHTQARESQFFNKVSASPTTAAATNTDTEQPNFLPQTDNSYGLYAHDSSQLPPSTTTNPAAAQPLLPRNYNPEAYVTVPEDINNFPYNPNSKYNYHYNGGGSSSFNSRPQGMSDTRFLESGKYFYDVNTDKYSTNHPYQYNYNNNFYGNSENAYEFNGEGYQTRDEFEDEEVINYLP